MKEKEEKADMSRSAVCGIVEFNEILCTWQ